MFKYTGSTTRRSFLATASLATAGVALGARSAYGLTGEAIHEMAHPAPIAISDLEALATAAIDEARNAGASYADVRVAERHNMGVRQVVGQPLIPDVDFQVLFTYGVRVMVNGAWSFAYGTTPNPQTIATSARQAIAVARTSAKLKASQTNLTARQQDFIAMLPVKGTWESPIKVNPFTIPVEDQIAIMWACQSAVERIPGAFVNCGFNWIKETRTFASTEGSLVTQTLYRSKLGMMAGADRGMGRVSLKLDSLSSGTGGYESLLASDLQDEAKARAEEAARFARLPRRSMDIGRYPVVLDGMTFGTILGTVAGQALELDRVLGDESGISGTSFLSPASDILGAQSFSPLLSVTANRKVPAINAVRWDDEGVAPQEYPVIVDGRVVNYHTSRQDASALAGWYQKQGLQTIARGCAVAPECSHPVLVRAPHLSAAPSDRAATIEDLCKDISHGLLVMNGNWSSVYPDQNFASGTLTSPLMLEIEKGKIIRRVRDAALQYNTKSLLKSLMTLGDASTLRNITGNSFKGQPWVASEQSTTAPAGLLKDIDVISTGRII